MSTEQGAGGREQGAGLLARFGSTLRRVVGMPDYRGYLIHMREKHPESVVLSEGEFCEVQMNARYGNGASRCC